MIIFNTERELEQVFHSLSQLRLAYIDHSLVHFIDHFWMHGIHVKAGPEIA
jgi:hypothetical protein